MQITFDTDKDTIDKVLAVTHAAFGVTQERPIVQAVLSAGGPVSLSAEDNPATGIDTTQKDKDGLPWDARVHSTPPTMTESGYWRAKRGRKDEDYATVKAEYSPAAPAAAPPAPSMPPAPAPVPAPAAKTAYQKLADFFASAVANGTGGATADWLKSSLEGMGVADGNIVNLQGEPEDKLEQIHASFKTALGVA